jgi:hypothetical protein
MSYNKDMQTIKIGNKDIELSKVKLKMWLLMADVLSEYEEAKKEKNFIHMAECMYKYLDMGIKDVDIVWRDAPWIDTVSVFIALNKVNRLNIKFPIFSADAKKQSKSGIDIEYPNRTWYLWMNLIASAYHWGMDTIAQLDVEDAIPLIQEIFIDQQYKREWEWSLSEIAYPYNSSTKKSKYVPLERPSWMTSHVAAPMKTLIRKDFMPVGNVIDLGKMGEHIK